MQWELDAFSKKYLKEITDAAKESEKIILATDPDREGEAIAHVKKVLEDKKLLKGKKLERVVFNEITKNAVLKGINNPREIENSLVNAYLARRALDYLVGFNISQYYGQNYLVQNRQEEFNSRIKINYRKRT